MTVDILSGSVSSVRVLDAADRARWLDAIDRWMELPAGHDVATTFPLLHADTARSTCFGAFDGERLLASACVRRTSVRLMDHEELIPMCFIGTVCCDPAVRRQGLASTVLDAVLDAEQHVGTRFAILWTNSSTLYERAGFENVGVETALEFDRAQVAALLTRGGGLSREASLSDLMTVSQLHAAKDCGATRTPDDWLTALACRDLQVVVHQSFDGQIDAYAMRGKGADFPAWWHEIGGDDAAVAALLADCAAADLACVDERGQWITIPGYRTALRAMLEPLSTQVTTREVAMARALQDGEQTRLTERFFIDGLDSV